MSTGKSNPRLRVLHTSPDVGTVDVYLDETLSISDLAFGQVSDYLALPPGDHMLRVYSAGVGGQGAENVRAELRGLQVGQDYTAIVVGKLVQMQAILLQDSAQAPAAGHAKVRAVHASPDAPPLDIALAGGPLLAEGVAFGQATPFREVAAGMVDLEVRASGTKDVIMALPDHTLAGGSLYTLVALGLLAGQPAFMVMPLVQRLEMQLPA